MGKKAKVVLDTNIWISILGREFDNLFGSEKIEVFVSEEILQEISRVLEYQKIKKILKKSGISSRDVLEEILREYQRLLIQGRSWKSWRRIPRITSFWNVHLKAKQSML